VAAIHAGRFRSAGLTHIADLGCGIGAESLALASLDIKVSAFELDEVTAAVATYNLANFSNVNVEQADVTSLDTDSFDGLFLDPARRDERKRKFDPLDFIPSYDFVLAKARTKPTIVKLGPGMDHDLIPDDAEAVWVSVEGELVEVGLYFGKVKRENISRAALLITDNGFHELTSPTSIRSDAELGELGEYIYEPDNSIIRSHLIGELASQLNLNLIANEIAYLTGESVNSPWLKKYKLIETLPFDRKKLKAYLKSLDVGPLEIKKRGADITPEQLRKELNLKGSKPATIIVTRVQDQHRVLIVEPVKQ
jgi:SAM-dependent methyltransferase